MTAHPTLDALRAACIETFGKGQWEFVYAKECEFERGEPFEPVTPTE